MAPDGKACTCKKRHRSDNAPFTLIDMIKEQAWVGVAVSVQKIESARLASWLSVTQQCKEARTAGLSGYAFCSALQTASQCYVLSSHEWLYKASLPAPQCMITYALCQSLFPIMTASIDCMQRQMFLSAKCSQSHVGMLVSSVTTTAA